jgi:Flp pilus assembly secretin CpaC
MLKQMLRAWHRSVVPALTGIILSTTAFAGPVAQVALGQAPDLLKAGRFIEAREMLLALDRETLSTPQRESMLELLASIDRKLSFADPIDVSLQRATLALKQGDLRATDRHANAARRADGASPSQQNQASDLLDQSAAQKLSFQPAMRDLLATAMRDLEQERYPQAKTALDRVYKSGIMLSEKELRDLERGRDRIIQVESQQGKPLDGVEAALGMLQPGRVTNNDDERLAQAQQGDDLFNAALRTDAIRLLSEADLAFEQARYNEALEKYTLVAQTYSEHIDAADLQRAQQRITETRVILQQDNAGLLDAQIGTREVQLQQARAEFDNFLDQAQRALSAGDTERARQLAGEARLRLAENRGVFSQQDYQNRLNSQQSLLQNIVATELQIRTSAQSDRDAELADEARRQDLQRQRERSDKIRESLLRIRSLQEEQKYEEALQVVDQLLFLDPQNPAGLLLKDTLQDVIIYREWSHTQRTKSLSYANEIIELQKSMIAPRNILDYPADWPEISFRRGGAETFAESPEDRRVLSDLESRRIPASFTDNALEDVIDFIATVTNLNLDVDWDSLADIGVDPDTLITLNLQPLPARVVLDRVLDRASPDAFSRAGWAVQDGVLVVASEDALRQNTFIVIYDVQDLLFRVPSFTEVPTLNLGAIQQGGGGGGQRTQITVEDSDELTREELLAKIIDIVQTNIDTDGWADNGGTTGQIQDLNGNLIVTNTAKNHRQISSLLNQLREVRAIQINVEARFLLVQQDFFEQIGFDMDIVFNAMNSQFEDAIATQDLSPLELPPSGRRNLLPSDLISPFFGGNRSGGTLNPQITNIDEIFDPNFIPDYALVDTPFVTTAPDGLSMIPVQQGSKSLAETLFSGGSFATNILATTPALGTALTFLDDIQVDILLEATEADRRSVQLTSPRLTFTNGSSATISVVTQTAFVSDLQPVVGTRSVAFDPQPGTVSEGFFMLVNGVVSADRRYVTMEIQTGISDLEGLRTFTVSAQTTGGGNNDTAPNQFFAASLEQPTIQTTIIRTGATIPDKGTMLLGGQRLSTETEIETGVPVLSQLPILNRLFSNRIESKEESTLLILLKPTILIQSEEEERNFPGLLDSIQNRFSGRR